MKTQYYTASTLDGFIATVDDSLDWLFPLGDIGATSYPHFIQDVGALAMGSHTYEWMLRHAIKPGTGEGEPWPYEQPTWVFSSRSLPTIPGADIRFVKGDVRPVHAHAHGEGAAVVAAPARVPLRAPRVAGEGAAPGAPKACAG